MWPQCHRMQSSLLWTKSVAWKQLRTNKQRKEFAEKKWIVRRNYWQFPANISLLATENVFRRANLFLFWDNLLPRILSLSLCNLCKLASFYAQAMQIAQFDCRIDCAVLVATDCTVSSQKWITFALAQMLFRYSGVLIQYIFILGSSTCLMKPKCDAPGKPAYTGRLWGLARQSSIQASVLAESFLSQEEACAELRLA